MTYPYIQSLRYRVIWALKNSGKSVQAVARDTGVSDASVYAWMRGDTKLRAENLEKLAQATGVDLLWLMQNRSPGEVRAETEKAPARRYEIHGEFTVQEILSLLNAMPQGIPLQIDLSSIC